MDKLFVNTYRRSGTIFISSKIPEYIKVEVVASHKIESVDYPSMTIIRDPAEAIASCVALDIFQKHVHTDLSTKVDSEIQEYISLTNHIINNVLVIFDFNDIDRYEEMFDYLKTRFSFKKAPGLSLPHEKPEDHIYTSKDQPEYKAIVDEIKKKDLSALYDVYNKAIALKVDLDAV